MDEKIEELILDALAYLLEKFNELIMPLIDKYVINSKTISGLVFAGMVFWLFKKKGKAPKKGRKKK